MFTIYNQANYIFEHVLQRENLDFQDQQAGMVCQAREDNQVLQGQWALLERMGTREMWDLRERKDLKDHKEKW